MNYQVTCLTPTLVGDGQKLSPIDYMVWKDHVNVLDQRRIFKLLAKGPRLDGYLAQVRKAEKLDFASWGGFAQNFAGRRIPFEHASLTPIWERQRAENLFIPTFAAGPGGPYLPASALRGALRTAYLFSRWSDGLWKQLEERFQGDRIPRRPADVAEESALGAFGYSRMRSFGIADSQPVAASAFKVYLVRTATLVARGGGKLELGWKDLGRGTVDGRRVDDATPGFYEMAAPGTRFEGRWSERAHMARREMLRGLRWREPLDARTLAAAANAFSRRLLELHKSYAAVAGLKALQGSIEALEQQLAAAEAAVHACLLPLGWGGGFLTKVSYANTGDEVYRKLLRQLPFYARAIQTGLPFPKTRRILFAGGEPASLPGWVRLDIESDTAAPPLSDPAVPAEG